MWRVGRIIIIIQGMIAAGDGGGDSALKRWLCSLYFLSPHILHITAIFSHNRFTLTFTFTFTAPITALVELVEPSRE